MAASLIFGKNSHRRQTCKDSNARLRCAVRTVMVPAIKMNPEQGRAEKAVLRHVSDLPRFGRCCGPPSCERRAALHWFDSHDGKSLIGVRVDDQAESSGKPEFRQKVRHGLDAVHGFNAAEFDPGCPRQLAIVPENPQHGFGVVRRMCGSKSMFAFAYSQAAPGVRVDNGTGFSPKRDTDRGQYCGRFSSPGSFAEPRALIARRPRRSRSEIHRPTGRYDPPTVMESGPCSTVFRCRRTVPKMHGGSGRLAADRSRVCTRARDSGPVRVSG